MQRSFDELVLPSQDQIVDSSKLTGLIGQYVGTSRRNFSTGEHKGWPVASTTRAVFLNCTWSLQIFIGLLYTR